MSLIGSDLLDAGLQSKPCSATINFGQVFVDEPCGWVRKVQLCGHGESSKRGIGFVVVSEGFVGLQCGGLC